MKGNRGLLLLIIALIAGGLFVFYYTFFGSKSRKQPAFQEEDKIRSEELAKSPTENKDILVQSLPLSKPQERLEEVESKGMKVEDEC